jgi:hypothetical protein
MKTFIAALIIICVGIATSYAGGFMMLHVGSSDGNGGVVGSCGTGVIDASAGCPLPMLGM